jgi:hypothetical protein
MLAGLIPTVAYARRSLSPCPGEESHLLRGIKTSKPTVYRRRHLARYAAVTLFVFSTGAMAWWISSNRAEEPERRSKSTWTGGSRLLTGSIVSFLLLSVQSFKLPLSDRIPSVGARILQLSEYNDGMKVWFELIEISGKTLKHAAKALRRLYFCLQSLGIPHMRYRSRWKASWLARKL